MNTDQVANTEVQAPTEIAQALPHVPGAEAYLNPCLYSTMVRRFGTVSVVRKGRPMAVCTPSLKYPTGVRSPGETYEIPCPLCSDPKARFSVGHASGTLHESAGLAVRQARCSKCGSAGSGREFFAMLDDNRLWQLATPTVPPPCQGPTGDGYESPGECIGLTEQDARSLLACKYLANHGIKHEDAAQMYGWRFCWQGDLSLWNGVCGIHGGCTNRIIVPVTHDGVEVGWLARLQFDPPTLLTDISIPNLRWLKMPGEEWRSRYLVGYDQAKDQDFCILMPSPIDMARQGPPSISAIGQPFAPALCKATGSDMSDDQFDLIASTWGNRRAIVVMGDTRVKDDRVAIHTVSELSRRCTCPVFVLWLPEMDPRHWDRQQFLQYVNDKVAEHSKGKLLG